MILIETNDDYHINNASLYACALTDFWVEEKDPPS